MVRAGGGSVGAIAFCGADIPHFATVPTTTPYALPPVWAELTFIKSVLAFPHLSLFYSLPHSPNSYILNTYQVEARHTLGAW